ncbi:MAG: hypothetical protein U1D55_17710 [Phycisphaerae bacterium]
MLEVLISLTLTVVLLAAALTFYWQTIAARDQAAQRAERMQLARQVLEKLAGEVRGCVGMEQIGFPVEQRLQGDRRSLTFLTSVMPGEEQYRFYRESEELPPAHHDLQQVTYQLSVNQDEQTEEGQPIVNGILRVQKSTLNQYVVKEDDPLEVRTDIWSPELKYLEFRYFDGVEWDTKWDITEGNSLPQLVQITVGYRAATADELDDRDLEQYPISDYPLGAEVPDPLDRYSVIVRIPAADRFFGSRVQRVGKQFSEQLGVEEGAK